jgi:AraC-like DNA-binding protein
MRESHYRHCMQARAPEEALRLLSASCQTDHVRHVGAATADSTYFAAVSLPGVDIFSESCAGTRSTYRRRRHIVADGARDFILTLPVHERGTLVQAGKSAELLPGTFGLFPMSIPFELHVAGAGPGERFSGIRVGISGAMLRGLVADLDAYPHLILKIRPGLGRIMQSLLESSLAEGHALSGSQAAELAGMLIETVANAVTDAPEIRSRAVVTRLTSKERVRELAKDFIARRLADPMLDCAMVAAHCEVSQAYLHLAFSSADIKPGGYIRELRLSRCRDDLCNPALRHRAIADIMMDWGFADATSFGRAYKARFGKTPSEERRGSLHEVRGRI